MSALAIFGISGRMGQALVRALAEESSWRLTGALAAAHSARLGEDASQLGPPTGIRITATLAEALHGASVAIDFSAAAAVAAHIEGCVQARVPVLIGVTGLDGSTRAAIEAAARHIPVLLAANTSLGVAVLREISAIAAAALGTDYDVEILEAHHRDKRDAPSGTALLLGAAVAEARGQQLADVAAERRAGARRAGSIGFAVLRGGDIVGEHTVMFAAAGERLEITHRVTDRMSFARGALRAAHWLMRQPAGLYGMPDVRGASCKD